MPVRLEIVSSQGSLDTYLYGWDTVSSRAVGHDTAVSSRGREAGRQSLHSLIPCHVRDAKRCVGIQFCSVSTVTRKSSFSNNRRYDTICMFWWKVVGDRALLLGDTIL